MNRIACTQRERYLEAFDLAASVFKPTGFFEPGLRIEAEVALYLIVGAGLSIAGTAEITGWNRTEVARMCDAVDTRCAVDADFNDKIAKLVRRFAAKLEGAV